MLIGFVACQEEPWADAPVKEELIDEITKEEPEVCFEG